MPSRSRSRSRRSRRSRRPSASSHISRHSRGSRGSKVAIKSNPKLWETIKNKWIRGSKAGSPGQVSARKMQLAVKEYKAKGGRYVGGSKTKTSLSKWGKEDWNYITPKSRSRRGTGRYLPKAVRSHLTSREKKLENKLKGSRYGRRIPYSKSVNRKVRRYKL